MVAMDQETAEQTWLSTAEVSEEIGVTRQTVRRYIQRGELRGVNMGGSAGWKVSRAALTAFLQRRELASGIREDLLRAS